MELTKTCRLSCVVPSVACVFVVSRGHTTEVYNRGLMFVRFIHVSLLSSLPDTTAQCNIVVKLIPAGADPPSEALHPFLVMCPSMLQYSCRSVARAPYCKSHALAPYSFGCIPITAHFIPEVRMFTYWSRSLHSHSSTRMFRSASLFILK